ncbi:hypothetical protein [Rhizobium sp. Root1203]|uniref:hypothetical protein n=1 Tax=Rhizobium sp. Root1203 TaxID=1736427 RepID=UPI001FCD322C|nr:hypothetical protein [Rhizobium sp. Root1203]
MSITKHLAEHDGAWAHLPGRSLVGNLPNSKKHWQRSKSPPSDDSSVARMRKSHISVHNDSWTTERSIGGDRPEAAVVDDVKE